MQQVKLFKGLESEIRTLEDEVNQWIRKTRVQVVSIAGNIAPQTPIADAARTPLGRTSHGASDILIVVTYDLPEKAMAATAEATAAAGAE